MSDGNAIPAVQFSKIPSISWSKEGSLGGFPESLPQRKKERKKEKK
jgi:hypothetical protein